MTTKSMVSNKNMGKYSFKCPSEVIAWFKVSKIIFITIRRASCFHMEISYLTKPHSVSPKKSPLEITLLLLNVRYNASGNFY